MVYKLGKSSIFERRIILFNPCPTLRAFCCNFFVDSALWYLQTRELVVSVADEFVNLWRGSTLPDDDRGDATWYPVAYLGPISHHVRLLWCVSSAWLLFRQYLLSWAWNRSLLKYLYTSSRSNLLTGSKFCVFLLQPSRHFASGKPILFVLYWRNFCSCIFNHK